MKQSVIVTYLYSLQRDMQSMNHAVPLKEHLSAAEEKRSQLISAIGCAINAQLFSLLGIRRAPRECSPKYTIKKRMKGGFLWLKLKKLI